MPQTFTFASRSDSAVRALSSMGSLSGTRTSTKPVKLCCINRARTPSSFSLRRSRVLTLGFLENRGAEELCDLLLHSVYVSARFKIGIDLDPGQARIDFALFTAEGVFENVRRRVGGIRRDQQDAFSFLRAGQRHGGCAGGLAHTSLAPEKQDPFLEKIAHFNSRAECPQGNDPYPSSGARCEIPRGNTDRFLLDKWRPDSEVPPVP